MDLENAKTYKTFATQISRLEKEWGQAPNIVFYLSVAPQLAPLVARKLYDAKLCSDPSACRIVFEKPFGHDLESATGLNRMLSRMFGEQQI